MALEFQMAVLVLAYMSLLAVELFIANRRGGYSMEATVKALKGEGFVVTGRTKDAAYMSRNADHRVVLRDGSVRRGQPGHRK